MNSRYKTIRTRDRIDWEAEFQARRAQATATKPIPVKPARQEKKVQSAEVQARHDVRSSPTDAPTGISYTYISCGVQFLYGLTGDPERSLKDAFEWSARYNNHKCAFYLFSDHNRIVRYDKSNKRNYTSAGEYAIKLAQYIQERGLGTITVSEEALNPNSSNKIQVFIWKVDHPALVKWCNERGVSCCNNIQMTAGGSINIPNVLPKPTPVVATIQGTTETKLIAQGISVRL